MSSRDWFWFLAGILVTVAITVALRPWLRARSAKAADSALPPFALPIAAALGLIGVALGIYFLLGSPGSVASAHNSTVPHDGAAPQMGGQSTNAGSLDDVTRKLANRLATQGGSDSEWQLLAESYEYMGKTAEAKAARTHVSSAAAVGAGSPPGAGVALAEGADASEAAGAAHDDAGSTGHFDAQTMAAVADALGSGSNSAVMQSSAAQPVGMPANAASAGPDATNSAHAQISCTVDIASKLASRAGASATVFIYARQPDAPGPPVAVVRLHADHWPVTFTLSDANSMVPGRNLSNAPTVQIEARISRNGDALPHSGDLVGSVTRVSPRAGRPVKISIDREIG